MTKDKTMVQSVTIMYVPVMYSMTSGSTGLGVAYSPFIRSPWQLSCLSFVMLCIRNIY